jgi:hypothetical protein
VHKLFAHAYLTHTKGDVVKIKSGAAWYTGTTIPSWVMADTWIVFQDQIGDRVALDSNTSKKNNIQSPINAENLIKV